LGGNIINRTVRKTFSDDFFSEVRVGLININCSSNLKIGALQRKNRTESFEIFNMGLSVHVRIAPEACFYPIFGISLVYLTYRRIQLILKERVVRWLAHPSLSISNLRS